jgi:hypothetical protein
VIRPNRILIPVGNADKGLKSIHYAMALAERLEVRIYIVQLSLGAAPGDSDTRRFEETLDELIGSARQAGLFVSHYLANSDLENEIIELVKREGIDVLVFSMDDEPCSNILQRIKPRLSLPIIQVREKDHVNYL